MTLTPRTVFLTVLLLRTTLPFRTSVPFFRPGSSGDFRHAISFFARHASSCDPGGGGAKGGGGAGFFLIMRDMTIEKGRGLFWSCFKTSASTNSAAAVLNSFMSRALFPSVSNFSIMTRTFAEISRGVTEGPLILVSIAASSSG